MSEQVPITGQVYGHEDYGIPAPKMVYLVFLNPGAATLWTFDDLKEARESAKAVIGGGAIVALPILEDYRS